jgi:hypothetical protein
MPPRVRAKLQSLLEGEGDALLRVCIAHGLDGNMAAARLALDRLMPAAKERCIRIELPTIESATDLPKAIGAIVGQVASGSITPSEGSTICGMLSAMRSAFELVDLAARIEEIERALPVASAGQGQPFGSGGTI